MTDAEGNSAIDPASDPFATGSLADFRTTCLARDIKTVNTGWEDVLVPLGLVLAGRAYDDAAMIEWSTRWLDHHLGVPIRTQTEENYRPQPSGEPLRGVVLSPYCGEWGVAMVLALADRDRHPSAVATARAVADYICDDALREHGVLVHGPWSRLVWVDTLYYAASSLARVFAAGGDERYAVAAIEQCRLHAAYLRDATTGCFFHDADPRTGRRTAWLWSRGNGWVIMAIADTLRLCPPELPGWSELLAIYRSLVTGLVRFQHPSGLWRIVPEVEESHLETSGSAMIGTGIAVGLAAGWLDPSLDGTVLRTWRELPGWIDKRGRLQGCQTPAGHGGWQTHKKSSLGSRTYGDGSLLRFAAEVRNAGLR